MARAAWTSFAHPGSTFVFNTLPPRPRRLCRTASRSPHSSITNRTLAPGVISASTSRTNSLLIPTRAPAAASAPPTRVPTAAPTSGCATTSPARNPIRPPPPVTARAGFGSLSSLNVPSGRRVTIATSSTIRQWKSSSARTTARARSAAAGSSKTTAHRLPALFLWLSPRGLSDRRGHDPLCLADDRVQVGLVLEALGVELVDVLGAGRPGREPATGRHDLQPADRGVVARGAGELRADRVARQL